jgi:hypothetical protein
VVIADSTPAIDIRKQAEGPDMQTLTVGSDIHFEIAVHNPGGVALSNVVVSDPAAPVCDRVIGTLDVDETFTYVCTVPAATFATMTFKDTFSAAAYDKNDGDSAWKGPWREEDAAGSGATRGNIKVDNGWLQLDDAPDTGRIPTLSRSANLSGKTRAFLSFDFKTTSGVDPSDVAAVKVSADGVHYTVLETFKGIDGTTSGSRSYDVSGFISDKTTIMFKIWDGYGGSYETFKVDNVMIVAFADTFNNEACASGEANGETVSDCDPSTVKVPVCVEQATGDARYAVSNSSHALYLPGIGTDFRFEPQAGPFTALADGTAQLTGTLRSVSHPNRGFVVDVTLSGRTSSPPSGSPKRDLKSAAYVENGGSVDTSTFVYYTNFSGTLTGIGDLEGAVLTISKTGPALQIGNGANNKNLNYGASAWLQWQVESQPDAGSALPTTGQGDLNLEFNADCFTGGSSDPQEPPDHNPPGHHMHMHARHSDKCLDVYGASTSQDADVIQWGCHSGANQEWSFQSMGDGTYEIIAAHSGKCLAVERGSSMPGANVIQRSCQGGVEQRWRLQPVGDGWYNIVAKHSGQCLDVSNNATTQGVSVTQWSCHGGANQKWRMVE